MICYVLLVQFRWRPRPRSLLSDEDKKKVVKDYRKYERKYDREDREREQKVKEEEYRAKGLERRRFRWAFCIDLVSFGGVRKGSLRVWRVRSQQ
jgi:hypothetical protein